eukprot:974734_1
MDIRSPSLKSVARVFTWICFFLSLIRCLAIVYRFIFDDDDATYNMVIFWTWTVHCGGMLAGFFGLLGLYSGFIREFVMAHMILNVVVAIGCIVMMKHFGGTGWTLAWYSITAILYVICVVVSAFYWTTMPSGAQQDPQEEQKEEQQPEEQQPEV